VLFVVAVGARSVASARRELRSANAFDALFYGLLPLSNDPSVRLKELGLPRESSVLVGQYAFRPDSKRFRAAHPELDHRQVLKLLWEEPRLLAVGALAAAGRVHYTRVDHTNLLAEDGDGRGRPTRWNLWGQLQYRLLPRGGAFWLAVFAAWIACALGMRSGDRWRRTAARLLGFAAGLAAIEVCVAFFADGAFEPTRHLAEANLAFGAMVAAASWLVSVTLAGRLEPRETRGKDPVGRVVEAVAPPVGAAGGGAALC